MCSHYFKQNKIFVCVNILQSQQFHLVYVVVVSLLFKKNILISKWVIPEKNTVYLTR